MKALRIHCPNLFDGAQFIRDVELRVEIDRVVSHQQGAGAGALRLPEQCVVAPGLIDVQVNGGGGVLFNDAPERATIQAIAHAHASCGTTALLPTFITDAPRGLDAAVASVKAAIEAGDRGILGVHLEGPYLQAGRKGIHPESHIAKFSDADITRLTALGPRGTTLVTLAPEVLTINQIRALSRAGALVFAGHTAATSQQMVDAVAQGGLIGATHLFNAMSQLGPRDAGVLGYALLHPELWTGLILDGHHVGRESFEVAWCMRGRNRTLLVSDAMPPAGTQLSHFMLQGRRIDVEDGRCVGADGTLAGAAITLSDAVRIGVTRYGMKPQDALYCASAAPAQLLGVAHERGHLRPGALADLVVFDSSWQVCGAMQSGRWLKEPAHG